MGVKNCAASENSKRNSIFYLQLALTRVRFRTEIACLSSSLDQYVVSVLHFKPQEKFCPDTSNLVAVSPSLH